MPMARLKERFAVRVNYLHRIRHIFCAPCSLSCCFVGAMHITFFYRTGCAFYLKPPATSRSPINQNDTMAKDALLLEKFISAECVR